MAVVLQIICPMFLNGPMLAECGVQYQFCLCWYVSKVYWWSLEDFVFDDAMLDFVNISKVYRRSFEGVVFDDAMPDSDDGANGQSPSPNQQPRVRVEFPETWLWSESSAGYHVMATVAYA